MVQGHITRYGIGQTLVLTCDGVFVVVFDLHHTYLLEDVKAISMTSDDGEITFLDLVKNNECLALELMDQLALVPLHFHN